MRISYDTENAIQVMQEGLKPTRPHSFAQADTIVRVLVLWFWSYIAEFFMGSLFLSSRGRY